MAYRIPPPAAPAPPESYLVGRWFTAARRQGLLGALAPEAWQTLSALLSFTSRDGRRTFTVDQLGLALVTSRSDAQLRLDDLERTQWHGHPLAALDRDSAGEVCGAALAPADILTRLDSQLQSAPEAAAASGSISSVAATSPAAPADLEAQLRAAGLAEDQVARLVSSFPADRIRRQLTWLPARHARVPAAFLVRAIEHDWGPPGEER